MFADALAEADFELDGAVILAALRADGWTGEPALFASGELWSQNAQTVPLAIEQSKRITDPWGTLLDDAPVAVGEAAREYRAVLRRHRDEAAGLPSGSMGLGTGERRSPWLIRDWLVRDRFQIIAGARGASKTTLTVAMIAASIKGEQFMGQDVPELRWFVISGEQTQAELRELFAAHGITPDQLDGRVYIASREAGVSLGDPMWNEWLAREVETFAPDVLVLDSISMVCTGVNAMDYASVRDLFRTVLHPLMDRHGLTILAAHHMRKGGGSSVEDVLGSSMWVNEADFVMNLVAHGRRVQNDDGTLTQRASVTRTKTSRVVADQTPEFYEITGKLTDDGLTDWLTVSQPKAEPTPVEQIVAALGAPLGRSALAKAVGMNATGTKFRDALAEAIGGGQVVKNDDGLYARTEA